MKIIVRSVLVDDQSKALKFYTDVLGFQVKHDIPAVTEAWGRSLLPCLTTRAAT